MVKKVIYFFILITATFILFELALMVLVKTGNLNILMPNYQTNPHEDFSPIRSNIFGHKHLPNSNYRVKKYCTETDYTFNELGFRDQLENKNSKKKRVVVIGDSFMEGVGVSEEERLSDLLESESGLKHLNFGMADKGTTQAYLIYDSIARQFNHNAILWSIFPTNDLIDDDPNFGKTVNGIKPCWDGDYPNYKLKFFPENAPQKKPNVAWKRFLKSYTYTYDALFFLKEVFKLKFSEQNKFPQSGYFNYNQSQVNRMIYSIEKLKKASNGKPITIICIPSTIDLDVKSEKNQVNIEAVLEQTCDRLDINFIGLFDFFQAKENPIENYYYECDSHWNPEGHKLVANILKENGEIYK